MKYNNLKGSAILVFTAFIWGIAFVAQSSAAGLVPPFTTNTLRCAIGALALWIFYRALNQKEKRNFFPNDPIKRKEYIKAALVCGICFAFSTNFQQFGIAFYPDGAAAEARSGFITSLYVVLVPVFAVFARKKVSPIIWLSVFVALTGFYFLCFSDGVHGIYIGDLMVFVCSIGFAVYIMAVDKYVPLMGGVKLTILQFAVTGIISTVLAIIFEINTLSFQNLLAAAPELLYLGVVSSGIAYTLQAVGQKYAEPAVASISMSLESVFAALGGWLISGNALSLKEILSCALVFAAIILAQIPEFFQKKNNQY